MRCIVPEDYLTTSSGLLERKAMTWPTDTNAELLANLVNGAMVIMDREEHTVATFVYWKHIKFPPKVRLKKEKK